MSNFNKPGSAATVLVSLCLALPSTAGVARADCLGDVETHRSLLERGQLETLDMNGDKKSDGIEAERSGASINDAGVNKNSDAEDSLEGTVSVETTSRTVTVPVGDGKPRESWFGNPSNLKTVEDFLDSAEIAAKAGDEEACLEQLNNARTATTAKSE